MAMHGAGPWATASQRLHRFINLDQRLAGELNHLVEGSVNDTKLAVALEAGRVYGMRQQRYDMQLKRQLNRDYRHPPVEKPW